MVGRLVRSETSHLLLSIPPTPSQGESIGRGLTGMGFMGLGLRAVASGVGWWRGGGLSWGLTNVCKVGVVVRKAGTWQWETGRPYNNKGAHSVPAAAMMHQFADPLCLWETLE